MNGFSKKVESSKNTTFLSSKQSSKVHNLAKRWYLDEEDFFLFFLQPIRNGLVKKRVCWLAESLFILSFPHWPGVGASDSIANFWRGQHVLILHILWILPSLLCVIRKLCFPPTYSINSELDQTVFTKNWTFGFNVIKLRTM